MRSRASASRRRRSRRSSISLFEHDAWPQTRRPMARGASALGIGPVGAAFYAWDIGVKRGDIRMLGVGVLCWRRCSRPLFLVLAGYAAASLSLALAARADRGRRHPRRQGHDRAGRRLGAGRPVRRRHLEAANSKSRRDRAADQRPVAEAFRRLPVARRHDALRPLARRDDRRRASCGGSRPRSSGHLEHQRRARIVVPDLDRIDPMPVRALAAREQEIDRRRGRASARIVRASRNVSR